MWQPFSSFPAALRYWRGKRGYSQLLPVIFRKAGVELKLFTTITTLGTPRDVTVHELHIESFFAADAATAEWFDARITPLIRAPSNVR